MTDYCKHHPTRPAHWICTKCGTSFCPTCILKRDKGGYLEGEIIHLCPKCVFPAQWVGASNAIEPFWDRLPKFFTYPFSSIQLLVLIFVLSVLSAIFSGQGLIDGLMRIAIGLVLIKYSFAALKATARGNLTPPKVDSETISNDILQAFIQTVFVVIIVAVFGVITATAGVALGVVFLIFGIISFPAIIMSYLATGSFFSAINPVLLVKLMFRIGWSYLLMYFFLILLYSAPAALLHFIHTFLPRGVNVFLFAFANSFYTIIFYHLMGYVLLQFHQEIGYRIDPEDFMDSSTQSAKKTEQAEENDENIQILNKVDFFIKEGKYDEALTFIKRETQEEGITDLALSEQYYKLLKIKKQTPALLAHASPHLKMLIQANRKENACEVFIDCLNSDNNLLIDSPTLLKLGSWLNETEKPKEAIKAYNKIIKEKPEDQIVPIAYFRAASIINEKLNNPARAKKILASLVKKFPNHDIIPQVENSLRQLSRT